MTQRPWWVHVVVPQGYEIGAMNGPLRVSPAIAHGLDDALLIVRAVNVRDDLVSALEEMLASHSMESVGIGASQRRIAAKERARAALLKARGEQP